MGAEAADPVVAVGQVVARYARAVDRQRMGELGALFHPDAELLALGKTYRGREAVLGWASALRPPERVGRHITVNTVVEILDGDHARATSDFVFAASDNGAPWVVLAVGEYRDEIETFDGAWVFRRREVELAPGAPGAA